MAKLYTRKSDGTYVPYNPQSVTNIDVVQTTGTSVTAAMSQDAVTKELATKQDTLTAGNGISIEGNVISASVAEVVDNIVNAGYVFAGVATPSTNPGTPDAKVFYLANGKGTYTNFGGIEVTEDEVVILYYDTGWHKVATGMASHEKLTELEEYAGNLRDFELTWETGKYISRLTGALGNATAYKASNRLDISGYSQIIVSAITLNDLSGYAFYDENGAFVSGGQLSVLSGYDVAVTTINVPDGANYFAFTTYINSIGEVYVRMGERLTDILDSFKASLSLDAISQKVLPTQETPVVKPYTEKAYISSKQEIIVPMESNVYSIASPVHLNKGDVLKGIWGIGANVAGLAIANRADATKFEVVLTDDASTSASPREYTATKDCYAFISFFVSNGLTKVKVIKVGQVDKNTSSIELLENRVSSIEESVVAPYQMALMRPICIGDSLTSGASYDEGWGELAPIGSSIDENYPRYLGKMLNCEVKNAGISGYSASDWWKKFINADHLDLSQYDSAFIWLGTNYGCSAMPTDAEINSFVPDPSAVASSSNQSLYLIEIIKTLREAHNDMFIVIMTCFASKSNATTNNQVVRTIAEKYGCHIIDNSDLSQKEHPELHNNINNPHFGKAGNIFIANRCCKEVQKILAENPLLCEFGYMARQN